MNDKSYTKMNELVNMLNHHTTLYDAGCPVISDEEWDKMYFELQQLEKTIGYSLPNSPTQKIHYEIKSELKKVKHNHPMLSLDKTKNISEFMGYFNPSKDVIGMLKLDGLTCSLRYADGKLVSAETRGNGEIGEDILHNALVLKSIPKRINYKDELIVDGEVICKYEDFKLFENEYKNPRNFASGSIRLLDSKECEKRNLTFIVWNVVKGLEGNRLLKKFFQLEKLGFEVVEYTSSLDWDWDEFLINRAKEKGFPIDGLVGRYDDIEYGESLGSTGHHTRAAYAFKFYDEEYETVLKNIEWTMGRTGALTPVAVFEPVDDGESIIERASLHNISILKETLYYPFVGQKIKVFKANQIIPQISWAEKKEDLMDDPFLVFSITIPDVCPICGAPVNIVESDTGVESLICENPHCEGKLINVLDHFCGKKGLDIKGLSKATLEKLISWGWVEDIMDLYTLESYKNEWINKAGFGDKSVTKILTAINNSRNCSLASFIAALGIPLIGVNTAKELANHFKTWDAFINAATSNYNFSSLSNFGYEMEKSLLSYNWEKVLSLVENASLTIGAATEIQITKNSLNGKNIVITGKLMKFKNRAELQQKIEELGGKVIGSVSKNTNYLIQNDGTPASTKSRKATELNIPIITEQEFIEKFLD